MTATNRGSLVVVSGPSGVGKTSLVHSLLGEVETLRLSISYTTRAPRSEERNGVDYFFVGDEAFQELIATGQLLEYARVFENYYGTGRAWVEEVLAAGDSVLLEIDWQGARQIRESFPDAVSVMILPPSMSGLESRLRSRDQDDETVIRKRMREADSEMSHFAEYDYLVINRNFDSAVADLAAIVRAAGLRAGIQQVAVRGALS